MGGVVNPYYQAGDITIYHGDCRDVLPALPRPHAIVTDPPYGIDYRHGWENRVGWVAPASAPIAGDAEPFDPTHLLAGSDRLVLWGANHYADRLPTSAGWFVWDKRGGATPNDQSDCELAWTNVSGTARIYTARWWGAVREGREQREERYHVSQKPVALMTWCLGKVGSGLVIDPYMGSGSTLRAAKDLGYPAIGIELEERYCEIAAKRLAQETLMSA